MAANVVTATEEREGNYRVVSWLNMIADSTGSVIDANVWELVSVQALGGAYDTSGEIDMEYSNDNSTFVVVDDNAGSLADMTFSADGLKAPGSHGRFYRPVTAANGAGAGVDVDIVAYFVRRKS